MIALNIERAYYDINKPVIENLTFEAARGETVAVAGQSGIGKSTLLKIIAGLHKNYTGTVEMDKSTRIAFMPQGQSLLPWKTVYENVTLLARTERRKIDREKALRLISALNLGGLEKQYPLRLSGGQHRRAALGQAFFYEPDLILMDEPFTGLDEKTKTEVMDLFMELQKDKGITTILVTHNMEETKYLNSRVVCML